MRYCLVAIAFVCGLPIFADAAESTVRAEALLKEIDSAGPRAVLKRLGEQPGLFDGVCDAIASAEPAWLEVARRLKSASDAGSSLSLNYSVARALPQAPERVLALIGRGFALADICTSPFIEPEP